MQSIIILGHTSVFEPHQYSVLADDFFQKAVVRLSLFSACEFFFAKFLETKQGNIFFETPSSGLRCKVREREREERERGREREREREREERERGRGRERERGGGKVWKERKEKERGSEALAEMKNKSQTPPAVFWCCERCLSHFRKQPHRKPLCMSFRVSSESTRPSHAGRLGRLGPPHFFSFFFFVGSLKQRKRRKIDVMLHSSQQRVSLNKGSMIAFIASVSRVNKYPLGVGRRITYSNDEPAAATSMFPLL